MVELDEIIEQLDPDTIHERVGKKHEEARVGIKVEKIGADDWEDFKKHITDYIKKHHKAAYGTEIDDHRAYALAHGILNRKQEEGGAGGLEAALAIGKKSLREIFDMLSTGMQTEDESAYRRHVLDKIDPFDFDAHTELMGKYITKYKAILPKGVKTKKPAQLAKNYEQFILAHSKDTYQQKGLLKAYDPKKKAA